MRVGTGEQGGREKCRREGEGREEGGWGIELCFLCLLEISKCTYWSTAGAPVRNGLSQLEGRLSLEASIEELRKRRRDWWQFQIPEGGNMYEASRRVLRTSNFRLIRKV